MNALFIFALLAAPVRAGVVAPVEVSIAPAGPSATAMPALPSAGGTPGAVNWGAALDLRGGLPLLPAPVPGLAGPALNFVGATPRAEAARSESAAASAGTPAASAGGRGIGSSSILPAEPAPGASAPAVARDRRTAGTLFDGEPSRSERAAQDAPASPVFETDAVSRPEALSGEGRRFFDLSGEAGRAALDDRAAPPSAGALVAATLVDGGAFAPSRGAALRYARPGSGASGAFAPGRFVPSDEPAEGSLGEPMRDAVAGVVAPAAAGGRAVFFRSAAPNGEASSPLARSAGAPGVAGAPRPLALDLSRTGLIVRVRSALGGVLAPAALEPVPSRIVPSARSTALLERGAILEAFSVAHAYADSVEVPDARTASSGARGAPSSPVAPSPASERAPLWWALLALPLLAAAIRGIL